MICILNFLRQQRRKSVKSIIRSPRANDSVDSREFTALLKIVQLFNKTKIQSGQRRIQFFREKTFAGRIFHFKTPLQY